MISSACERVHPQVFHDQGAHDRVSRAHLHGNEIRVHSRVRAGAREHVRVRVRARESGCHHHAGGHESGCEHAGVYDRDYVSLLPSLRSPNLKWFNSNDDNSFIHVGLQVHVVKPP